MDQPKQAGDPLPDAVIPDKFVVPPTLLTPHTWTDTVAVSSTTFGKGVWVRNAEGVYALRKPGLSTPGSLESIREITCSVIARWLQVPTPHVELLEHPTAGPCILSYDLPTGQTYRWFNVMVMQLTESLFASGQAALYAYAGKVVVLDCLVGATDRVNVGNHLFVENERRWYTIDYGLSFNRFPRDQGPHDDGKTGVGDKALPFGSKGWQGTFPELLRAIDLHADAFLSTIALAESIPDDRLEALVALPPVAYASDADRQAMCEFLKYRRTNLRSLLGDWCSRMGLPGIQKQL